MADAPRFGEKPLAQTVAAAGALRRLTGLLLAIENDHPTVDGDAGTVRRVGDRTGRRRSPPDSAPRIGDDPDGRAAPLPGPRIRRRCVQPVLPRVPVRPRSMTDTASGSVTFPVVYEGPPGLVHGGFLGVFFDCVTQHHNCATRLSGKTRSLTVKYRRPTPDPHRVDLRRRAHRGRARADLDGPACCSTTRCCASARWRRWRCRPRSSPAPGSAPRQMTDGRARDSSHRIRQPRVAEIVASRLRDDILSGRLKEGDMLPVAGAVCSPSSASARPRCARRSTSWRPTA